MKKRSIDSTIEASIASFHKRNARRSPPPNIDPQESTNSYKNKVKTARKRFIYQSHIPTILPLKNNNERHFNVHPIEGERVSWGQRQRQGNFGNKQKPNEISSGQVQQRKDDIGPERNPFNRNTTSV